MANNQISTRKTNVQKATILIKIVITNTAELGTGIWNNKKKKINFLGLLKTQPENWRSSDFS